MQLNDFVSETLRQVIEGVIQAQKYAGSVGARVNPSGVEATDKTRFASISGIQLANIVDFDVAVTTIESDQVKGGIGIFVGPIGAGTQGITEGTNSTMNRIRFSVPVMFPYQKPGK